MNEEICCIINKGETAKNYWKNYDSNFLQPLYCVYKKLEQFFFNTHLLIFLKKDISVLLKVINI